MSILQIFTLDNRPDLRHVLASEGHKVYHCPTIDSILATALGLSNTAHSIMLIDLDFIKLSANALLQPLRSGPLNKLPVVLLTNSPHHAGYLKIADDYHATLHIGAVAARPLVATLYEALGVPELASFARA